MPTRLAFYRLLPLAGALAVLALVAGPLTRPIAPPADSSPAPTAPPAVALQALWAPQPLAFEANHGQADAGIDFVARGRGYTLALAGGDAVFTLRPPATVANHEDTDGSLPRAISPGRLDFLVSEPAPATRPTLLHMKLVGANPVSPAVGLHALPGKVNYYIGNDPAQWRTGIATYRQVRFADVYPGIDLVYYGNEGQLEYDFILAPGADPSAIALAFEGADSLAMDERGDLVLQVAGAELRQHAPLLYQEQDGARVPVAGAYVQTGERAVSLAVGAYDAGRPLVIDPVLAWATYRGGSDRDEGTGIAVDSSGNVAVTGWTEIGFGTLQMHRDAVVTKYTSDGVHLWTTYLGDASPSGIAVDSNGNVYITGGEAGPNFPVLNAAQSSHAGFGDAILAKLAGNGTVTWATFLGGQSGDSAYGIAVDGTGNVYVTGETAGNFPVLNAGQTVYGGGANDAFVAKYTTTGALVWATYLGGTGNDHGSGIAVDSSGNVFVTGYTSGGFPVLNAAQPTYGGDAWDAFVAKLTTSGALVWATYLGGSGIDEGYGIAVDSSGNAYVVGSTNGTNGSGGGFPVVAAAQSSYGGGSSDAFVAKYTTTGAVVWATYLGGSRGDGGNGIAVDSSGNAYVAGQTSGGFPVLNAAQPTYGGAGDALVAKLTSTGALPSPPTSGVPGTTSQLQLLSTAAGTRISVASPEVRTCPSRTPRRAITAAGSAMPSWRSSRPPRACRCPWPPPPRR